MGLPNFKPIKLHNGATVTDHWEYEQIRATCIDVIRVNRCITDCTCCVLWRCRLCDYNQFPPEESPECDFCANITEDCPITGDRGLLCDMDMFTKTLLEVI